MSTVNTNTYSDPLVEALLPRPKRIEICGDSLLLPKGDINIDSSDERWNAENTHFIDDPAASESEDGYRIIFDANRITAYSRSKNGKISAKATLAQMARAAVCLGRRHTNIKQIDDAPDFAKRGYMLDISRDKIPKLESLYATIDLLASLKYNHLQLYTEHAFAYKGHEEVWRDATPYTADDILAIIDYAHRYGIEVVPNQNSYGHMERWLKHKRYRHLAECPDGFVDPWGVFRAEPSTLNPQLPESIDLIRDIYSQYLPLFKTSKVNVGGDEPWEHCKGRSVDYAARLGSGKVYLQFMLKLRDLAGDFGKSMQMWGDIIAGHPELVDQLPRDIDLLEWGYEHDHPFAERCAQYEAANLCYYVCAGTSAWNSLGGRWDNAYENIRNATVNGLRHAANGFIVTEWGDVGNLQQSPIGWPGIAAGAAFSWNNGYYRDQSIEQSDDAISLWLALYPLNSGNLSDDTASARALLDLGHITRRYNLEVPNASLPFAILLDNIFPYYRETYSRLQDYDWHPLDEELGRIGSKVGANSASKPSPWRDEIHFSCHFLRYAAKLSAHFCAAGGIAAIEPSTKRLLRDELGKIINWYEACWNRNARPGGLQDSAQRLRQLYDLY